MAATYCSNLHPLIHLGGRSFLATSKSVLQLSTGPMTTSPLAVYHLPCNVSLVGMITGIGTSCPDHIRISVPLSMASSLQFIPRTAAATNTSRLILNHPTFHIPAPVILNHTVVAELDATLATLDGKLTALVSAANVEIDTIHAGTSLSSTDNVAYVALSFSIISPATCLLANCFYRKHGLQHQRPHDKYSCGKLGLPTSAGDQTPPGMVQEERVHTDTWDGGSREECLRTDLHHQ